MAEDLKSAALLYAEKGFSVFPLMPGEKRPATAHGFKDATRDPDRIRQYWSENPTYNIGIATGDVSGGLLVIDLDRNHEQGVDGITSAHRWQQRGGDLPDTVSATTCSGGLHLLYRAEGQKSGAGILPGVDVRANGGYIVAAPSIVNGKAYEWNGKGFNPDRIAQASPQLLQLLSGSGPDPARTETKADMIQEGQRVNALVSLIGSLRSRGLTTEAIEAAVRAENMAHCTVPLTEKELQKEVFPALSRGWEPNRPYTATAQAGPLTLETLSDTEELPVEWLIPGYIPRGAVTILGGDGGAGKTALWCDIAAAITAGNLSVLEKQDANPFFGKRPEECGTVIFFSAEDSVPRVLLRRLKQAGADPSRIKFIEAGKESFSRIKFDSAELLQIVAQERPTLVIFDPLQSFIPPMADMAKRNTMRQCMTPLLGMGEEYGTTFLVICHTNKRIQASGRQRFADSADIWDIARSALIAGSTGDEQIRDISQEKSNYGELSPTILYRIQGGCVQYVGTTEKRDADFIGAREQNRPTPARDEAKQAILETLKSAGELPAQELNETIKALGISRATLDRAKAELKEAGKLVYERRGYGEKGQWFARACTEQ